MKLMHVSPIRPNRVAINFPREHGNVWKQVLLCPVVVLCILKITVRSHHYWSVHIRRSCGAFLNLQVHLGNRWPTLGPRSRAKWLTVSRRGVIVFVSCSTKIRCIKFWYVEQHWKKRLIIQRDPSGFINVMKQSDSRRGYTFGRTTMNILNA